MADMEAAWSKHCNDHICYDDAGNWYLSNIRTDVGSVKSYPTSDEAKSAWIDGTVTWE